MIKQLFLVFVIMVSIQSCKQQSKVDSVAETPKTVIDSSYIPENNRYQDVVFDSKKDLVCGMPTSAGVSDTLHYKDKLYGFCSKECKAEFVKNPSAFLTSK